MDAEQKLKAGDISAIVATASLELGIDVGTVDLVCHVGAPRAIATLLQRVGRAGHMLGAVSKGILYPLTRDELVQSVAVVRAVGLGQLDEVRVPDGALDILAQQIVAWVAGEADDDGMDEAALYDRICAAWPYRGLSRATFDEIVSMLAEGTNHRKGRRGAWLHRDAVNGRLWPRRGARMTAITSGGAIPDAADYDVLESPSETFVGRLSEDYALEAAAGDVFLLGNRAWRIQRVSGGRVFVEDAHGLSPSVPFWFGEAPSRTPELSEAVCEVRRAVAERLSAVDDAVAWLQAESGCPRAAAEQIVAYLAATERDLGVVPTTRCVVAERFFDESGGMQLVLHAPFGGRLNRAWGLALRKRFCVTFDFELQAAATDDGLVLSLGEQHSFPLDSVFAYVRNATLREDLVQAVIPSPMFANRWRWNVARSLSVPRFQGGRKVPMNIQRMRAEDLLSAVAPQATACQDNRTGPVDLGDHPLIRETLQDCLHEAMDMEGLRDLVDRIRAGEVRCLAVETPVPSEMSAELLNASPYAFLDDAPLEERRARAVSMRRADPALARDVGALDAAAVDEVRGQAWPDVRTANDLHDALLGLVQCPLREAARWPDLLAVLVDARRATVVDEALVVATERVETVRLVRPSMACAPAVPSVPPMRGGPESVEEAVTAIVQGWVSVLGPVNVEQIAQRSGLDRGYVEVGLLHLEARGVVLQGYFTPGEPPRSLEWCERGLLARIHRLTLGRLRRDVEPVTAADYIRFLLRWQHVMPHTRLHGADGVLQVIAQLQGLELPAPAWEECVLSSRVAGYSGCDLENLCLGGTVAWGRLRVDPGAAGRGAAIGFLLRDDLPVLLSPGAVDESAVSEAARAVLGVLSSHGALFAGELARLCASSVRATEAALWELVSHGSVSGDGVAGLRALLKTEIGEGDDGAAVAPPARPVGRGPRALRLIDGKTSAPRLLPLGRWFRWRVPDEALPDEDARVAFWAEQLLRRYGVVFREVVTREPHAPAWRLLLRQWRRMEAQGRIRGGRFVSGFVGEQFALPEAVESLRALRRVATQDEVVVVPASDPLNLVGVLTPGARLSPYGGQAVMYRNGVPVETGTYELLRRAVREA